MKKDLCNIKGFSDVKVEKLKEAGKKMMVRAQYHLKLRSSDMD
jgi:hypothetical protein